MADPDQNTLVELGRLLLAMSQNKDTRPTVLKAVKKVDKTFELPDDIVRTDVLETVDSRFAERDAKEAADRIKAKLASDREGLIDGKLLPGRKFSEDDVKKIEGFMEEKGYTDYADAAVLWGSSQKPPEPSPEIPSAGMWEMPKVTNPFDTGSLTRDATKRAYQAIAELRSRTAA